MYLGVYFVTWENMLSVLQTRLKTIVKEIQLINVHVLHIFDILVCLSCSRFFWSYEPMFRVNYKNDYKILLTFLIHFLHSICFGL